MKQFAYIMGGLMLLLSAFPASAENPDPLAGWNILAPEYDQDNWLDVLSYEWEYFTIADEQAGFNAVIGYLVSNPRARFSNVAQLLPDGGNVAIIGQVGTAKPIAQYINFGLANYEVGTQDRYFDAEDPWTGNYATLEPLPSGGPGGVPAKRLLGRSDAFEWDLLVWQKWPEREMDEPRPVVSTDIGYLPGEKWWVDIDWPVTQVEGTVVVRATGKVLDIETHGYHDNAWGRYLLTPDGWETFFFSESEEALAQDGLGPDDGVSVLLHAYHKSQQLDFADATFYDQGELQRIRFRGLDGETRWYHPQWKWDPTAWQCVPVNTVWTFENDEYRINMKTRVGYENAGTLLSDISLPVKVYFINEHFPFFEGSITHKPSGRLVRKFAGRGAGEFSFHKSARLWPASTLACNLWGKSIFYHR